MVSTKGTFVAVVDKTKSDRVVWKTLPKKGGYVPEAYRELLADLGKQMMAGQIAVLNYAKYRAHGADKTIEGLPWGKEHAADIRKLWQRIGARSADRDLELAVWTLDHNPNQDARRAAILVLGNFLDRDLAWWTLIDALRDPVERVRGTAMSALYSALKGKGHKVDWRPASRSIAHLLNGTHIGAVGVVAKTLLATEVDPKLARELVEPGAHALLDYVGAKLGFAHNPTRQLLERFTGAKHGRDAAKWQAALAALK